MLSSDEDESQSSTDNMEVWDDPNVQEFIRTNSLFASSAYKEILKIKDGNFLISPLSAEIVLCFAYSGCRGETAQEIQRALHLPDGDIITQGIKTFLVKLNDSKNYSLQSANKMYVKTNYLIKEEFNKTALETYQAESENIDFTKSAEAAKRINNWVKNKTNNKIDNLISSDDLDKYTRVILLNALYFKADWLVQFTKADTREEDFYVTAQNVIKVDMLHYYADYKRWFNYHENKKLDAKFLELMFKGEDASMVFALPNQKEGLSVLEEQIDLVLAAREFKGRLVNVALPKFKIDNKIDVKHILENLGVLKAFDDKEADLSSVAGKQGDLLINKIQQKTFLDLNENGVEAAAATFLDIFVPMSYDPTVPPEFRADHPFIFYIKIKGAIVFIGRVTEPEQ